LPEQRRSLDDDDDDDLVAVPVAQLVMGKISISRPDDDESFFVDEVGVVLVVNAAAAAAAIAVVVGSHGTGGVYPDCNGAGHQLTRLLSIVSTIVFCIALMPRLLDTRDAFADTAAGFTCGEFVVDVDVRVVVVVVAAVAAAAAATTTVVVVHGSTSAVSSVSLAA
jgi:hypothetical protein